MPTIHTLHPENNYSQVSRAARDDLPSLAAIGYQTILMSYSDGYVPSLDSLRKKKPGITKAEASKARKQLFQFRYRVDVRWQVAETGKWETAIWRSHYPHTEQDLVEIASRYPRGGIVQVPVKDEQGKVRRDTSGQVITAARTIRAAVIDSWRGEGERITPDGTLDQHSAETDQNTPSYPQSPGRTDLPKTGGSALRGVGLREVKIKEGGQDHGDNTSQGPKNCRPTVGDLGEPGFAGTPEVTETPGQLPNGSPTGPVFRGKSLPPRAHVIPEVDHEVNPTAQEFSGSSEKDTSAALAEDHSGFDGSRVDPSPASPKAEDQGEKASGPVDLPAAGRAGNASHSPGDRRNAGSEGDLPGAGRGGCGASGCQGDGWRTLADSSLVPCKPCRTQAEPRDVDEDQADTERDDPWNMPLVDLPF
ncbi:hypothetical protein [Saccharopolyspora pogona]|uniref:hypothetical protein n=1 Tax=Saccharopolyspora pogona TaxID=333966 RepID=UPI0016853CB8|nr:hypothetical protein [Saccharopolyspora pogona]